MKKLLSSVLFFTLLTTSTFANNGTSSIRADEMITNKTGVATDSLGLATGVYFIYEAVQNFKGSKDVAGGLTSAALGISTALGAVTFVSKANASERVDIKDQLKRTTQYDEIAKRLGEDVADEFVLDVLAGWSVAKLHEKYNLSEDETTISEVSRDEVKRIETPVQYEYSQQSTTTMSVGK